MKNFLVGLLFMLTIPIWFIPVSIWAMCYLLGSLGEDLIKIYKGRK